jgi:hypothetical protein
MKMPRSIAITLCILFTTAIALAQSSPQLNRDPEAVKFVTSDIENFWRAYDLRAPATRSAS